MTIVSSIEQAFIKIPWAFYRSMEIDYDQPILEYQRSNFPTKFFQFYKRLDQSNDRCRPIKRLVNIARGFPWANRRFGEFRSFFHPPPYLPPFHVSRSTNEIFQPYSVEKHYRNEHRRRRSFLPTLLLPSADGRRAIVDRITVFPRWPRKSVSTTAKWRFFNLSSARFGQSIVTRAAFFSSFFSPFLFPLRFTLVCHSTQRNSYFCHQFPRRI